MESFRFIHAADLHLDSPFRGLANTSTRLRDELQAATLGAFERIVDHTIESKADFLLLAGDLYDSKDRSLRALVAFRRQMERLAERDISVYIVHGNHDPLNGWGSEFQLPPNVTTFSGKPATEAVIRRGKEVARVTGISYARERVTENLAAAMKPDSDSPYSVGLLHANVAGQIGHADYAPVSLDELTASGFDYWALGHVHTRSVLAENPSTVVYPGNPQGRNPREAGPRGCVQVDVNRNGDAHLSFVETNLARWTHLEIPIQTHTRMDSLINALLEEGRIAAASFRGPVVARCTLRGNGPLHADLQRDGMAEELSEQLRSVVPVESVRIATGPVLDFESLTRTESLVADFIKLADRALDDPELRKKLTDSLEPLFRRRDMALPDDVKIREWVDRARALGVDLLMES
ncbi:MAG TPA: DNA repair exonuclease [Terriglobia bacterium]|nr:DNA repair exonuclease [Terriglobia bacterium]